MINAIGPVWDGNSTWIVIGGGVLFAAFPKVFGTLMSGFYTPMMMIIFGFMVRGAAVEFRSKQADPTWRRIWDICFFGASLLLTLVFGLLLGNLVEGIPLTAKGEIQVSLLQTLKPYPILIMLLALSLFMMHGSIYLLMKLEGELHNRIRRWVNRLIFAFLFLWTIATLATCKYNHHMIQPFADHPVFLIFPIISIICISMIPLSIALKKDGLAFIASCFSIVFQLALFGVGTFPYLAISSIDPAASFTIYNSSVSHTALLVLAIVSFSGLPLAVFYALHIYHVFRGKVKLDSHSY